ncbi:MAG: T9SS type A sorting domain-containing protein [Bacteroidota bacterium]
MKKLITTALSLALLTPVFAQIQIVRTDFGDTGDKIYVGGQVSFTAPLSAGPAGANKTWDFSASEPDYFDSTTFISATGLPNAPEEATHGVITGEDTAYFIVNNDAVTTIIQPQELPGFEGKLRVLAFPLDYLDSFSDTVKIAIFGTPAEFGIPFPADSVRIIGDVISESVADGYGTLKTPTNNYEALRVKAEIRTNVAIGFKLLGSWSNFGNQIDTTKTISWYAKNGVYAIATANLDSTGFISDFEWQVDSIYEIIPTGLSAVLGNVVDFNMYPNPASSILNIEMADLVKEGVILDLNGREVMQFTGNTVNTAQLGNGLYQVLIKTEYGLGRKRLLIQH